MRNVFTINSACDGCNYVRIMLPTFHNGFYTDKPSLRGERLSAEEVRKAMEAASIVVFHRPENKRYHDLADMLKKDGKKIVMDNDDTFRIDDHHPLAEFQPDGTYAKELDQRISSIDDFMLKSDLVTTSTEFLAKEYRKITNNVVVLPNCVDPMDWDEPLRTTGKQVRIGMVGSVAYEYDYLHLKPLIEKLSKRDDIKFVLFGLGDNKHRKENPNVTKAFKDEYAFWDGIDKEQIPWCPVADYPSKLNEAKLDMMLIPRKDNYFNRCKSNIKFLEAAMCEIPVIAQSFKDGPYEEVRDGKTGWLIRDNKDWEKTINFLIDNKEIRREIGRNARQYTLKHFNIEDHAHKWADAYMKILNIS